MHLSLAFLMVFALGIENSYQNIDSDEDHEGKCTMHAYSDDYQTAVEVDYESYNPKGTNITRKLLSKSSCKCYLNLFQMNYSTVLNYAAAISCNNSCNVIILYD